jgi:hypothetical protein
MPLHPAPPFCRSCHCTSERRLKRLVSEERKGVCRCPAQPHPCSQVAVCKAFRTCLCSPPERMWCRKTLMTNYPYILFNKSPLQLRLIGARGGRAYGRNLRLRRALLPVPPEHVPLASRLQTTAEAISMLDAQFPWLRAAELRVPLAAGVRRASTAATTTRRGPCAPQ